MRWISLILLLSACVTSPRRIENDDDRLFPFGIYEHRIDVRTEKGRYNFKSLVKLSRDGTWITGLSPFSTTIFELHDDFQKVAIEIFQDALKAQDGQVKKYYFVLRELFEMPKSGPDKREVSAQTVHLLEFDSQGVPKQMRIEAGDFQIHVEVLLRED